MAEHSPYVVHLLSFYCRLPRRVTSSTFVGCGYTSMLQRRLRRTRLACTKEEQEEHQQRRVRDECWPNPIVIHQLITILSFYTIRIIFDNSIHFMILNLHFNSTFCRSPTLKYENRICVDNSEHVAINFIRFNINIVPVFIRFAISCGCSYRAPVRRCDGGQHRLARSECVSRSLRLHLQEI